MRQTFDIPIDRPLRMRTDAARIIADVVVGSRMCAGCCLQQFPDNVIAPLLLHGFQEGCRLDTEPGGIAGDVESGFFERIPPFVERLALLRRHCLLNVTHKCTGGHCIAVVENKGSQVVGFPTAA